MYVIGQRWISESEPELGLATVVQTTAERVQVEFKAAGETRTYAAAQAPLRRVRFRVGEKVKSLADKEFVVREVIEEHGLLTYVGNEERLPEARLSDRTNLRGPQERLVAGRLDTSRQFALRRRTLELLHRLRKSPVRGFLGGRIDLIPHQLYIAHEVAGRQAARVMLSDEVGLGKTIEACLILHRLLLSGRASRILVVVPEPLVHQWFVEMFRRFNILLNIFDEERCAAIEIGEPGANPFLDDQLVLTSIQFLAADPRRAAQAVAARWDVLVVDEAHHLEWTEAAPSREYEVVEALSRSAEGLLLLTATPEQLGVEGHFARLRLLDPDRYRDLATFQAEARDYGTTADIAEKLSAGQALTKPEQAVLARLLADEQKSPSPRPSPEGEGEIRTERRFLSTRPSPKLERFDSSKNSPHLGPLSEGEGELQGSLSKLEALLDLHGPGRVLFRNTRRSVKGFPARMAHLARLDVGPEAEHWLDRASMEFAQDAGDARLEFDFDLAKDPRVLWLVELLQRLDPEKVLLIARSIEKAEALDAALRTHLSVKTGIFHEGLTLLQRDRNAAWFSEPEGARLLICSEIGSEGRNFQFAHHLVLFDLPINPELLEQRIGRLDRIGQSSDIRIHVPFLVRSPQEVLARWYHEGLNAFESNLEGGHELLQRFGRAVHDLALEFPVAEPAAAEQELAGLLHRTKSARLELRDILERGRDRLLELNSFRPAIAEKIIAKIREEERRPELQDYLLEMFDHFGVHIEDLASQTWQLNAQGVITDSFPSIPPEGVVATCDRVRALGREDVAFLTWDHPMVIGAMELLLGTETGNCAFAILPDASDRTLLVELIFVLETIASPRLHADRFLPLTPVRVVISHKFADLTADYASDSWEQQLQAGSPYKLIENDDIARRVLPGMFEKGRALAEAKAMTLRQAALQGMNQLLSHELERLQTLAKVNDHIRPEEIRLAQSQRDELSATITQSSLRLEAVRLIWKGSPTVLA